MLDKYDGILFSDEIRNEIACPWLNHAVVKSLGYINSNEIEHLDSITVYPARYFDPISTGNTENLLCEDTVSIHHYSASWESRGTQLKRKLIRIFGEKNYHKVKKLFHKAK
jgi:hypothetical protein